MKKYLLTLIFLTVFSFSNAQDNTYPEGTEPASTNIPGAQYPRIDSERKAYFRIEAPAADSVSVGLGNTALTKDEKGVWTGVTAPLDPGFHYYTLKINGVDVNDPNSETFYGASRVMSGIEVPEEGVDFYEIKNVPHGKIESHWYFAESTGEMRLAYVYTPPGYDENTNQNYPVLYLQHGMGEDRRAWPNQGRTNFILDNLIAEGKAQPMIVVMEDGGIAQAFNSPKRPQDENFWDSFEDILVKDLIPNIDTSYRTFTERENRAIAGLSLGGTQTYQISQSNLDKFANIGIFSAPFGFPGVETGYDGLLQTPEEFEKRVNVYYVSMGSKEGARAGRSTHEALENAGIKHTYYEAPGTAHEFQTWRKSLNQFAQLIFEK